MVMVCIGNSRMATLLDSLFIPSLGINLHSILIMYKDLVCDYFYGEKPLTEYNIQEQQTLSLAMDIIRTHGVGGKFVESLIRHRFGLKDAESIHGWDGYKSSRPVEIKTETINKTKLLNCEGSFGDHRKESIRKKDLFLKERPFLYSVGVDDITGKCLYVMCTDTRKIPEDSIFFERLDAKAPRIRFGHWSKTKSYKIVFVSNLARIRSAEIDKKLMLVLQDAMK